MNSQDQQIYASLKTSYKKLVQNYGFWIKNSDLHIKFSNPKTWKL